MSWYVLLGGEFLMLPFILKLSCNHREKNSKHPFQFSSCHSRTKPESAQAFSLQFSQCTCFSWTWITELWDLMRHRCHLYKISAGSCLSQLESSFPLLAHTQSPSLVVGKGLYLRKENVKVYQTNFYGISNHLGFIFTHNVFLCVYQFYWSMVYITWNHPSAITFYLSSIN